MDAPASHAGRLLVATQGLVDPNFARSVILLLEHEAEGAVGVILNRPGQVPIAEALETWAPLAAEPAVVFGGGPVQPEAVIALGRTRPGATAAEVLPGLAVVDLRGDPALAAGDYRSVRLFAGYAGWGPGQLEAEVADGGWFLVDGEATDVLSASPDSLWRVVLARQGGVFLTVAEDPTLN